MAADRIEIRGLCALGHHGANPGEQDLAQPFEVDLLVETDLSVAGASDELGDTVDYGALCTLVAAAIRDERYALLEALAERLAALALGFAGVDAVTVTLRKLRPPVPTVLRDVGVSITRRAAAAR